MDIDKTRKALAVLLNTPDYVPAVSDDLAAALEIPEGERPPFFDLLRQLEKEDVLYVSKSKKISNLRKKGYKTARMLSLTKTGGFAALDDGTGDIFIRKGHLLGALPGDILVVKIRKSTGRLPEAGIVKVLERRFTEFTGTFYLQGHQAFVQPDSGVKERIEVSQKDLSLAHDKDKVFARIKKYGTDEHGPTASIIASYGPAGSAASCCEAVLDRHHVRRDFPASVLEEAKTVSESMTVNDGRLDLRDRPIFTIDSEHSKDLDDAVSVEKTEDGFMLGVHIADVSYYVSPGSELDKEAFARGTSIYYANSVIPMLPKELSNGICSLNPNEDRLAFSVFMNIDGRGNMTHFTLHKSVIRSRVKGVYEEVNRILAGEAPEELTEKYREVLPGIGLMRELSAALQGARERRGAIDFDTSDCEIQIGADGVIIDVLRRERGEAERLIEEFMLCANEAVATYASRLKMPFVYRVHEQPEPRKLEEFATALKAAGIDARSIKAGLRPGDMAAVLKKVADTPRVRALNDLALRSLAKARYSPECLGHFGLALEFYSQFTSPIRRYPDLTIHRILSDILENGAGDAITKRYRKFVEESSEQSSKQEVNAMQVEWDCDAIYKAEYMTLHLGETFEGVISSVKSFGMYVELDNTVEGLVRVENLPGWYDYDEKSLTLHNATTGMHYAIGDKVKVLAAKADVSLGQVDFEIVQG